MLSLASPALPDHHWEGKEGRKDGREEGRRVGGEGRGEVFIGISLLGLYSYCCAQYNLIERCGSLQTNLSQAMIQHRINISQMSPGDG